MSNIKKIQLGQFFTVDDSWLTAPVKEFVLQNIQKTKKVLDPFAGGGDLLEQFKSHFDVNYKYLGFDIDKTLNWKINDSLSNIPTAKNTFIITNPPYLSKSSANRKNLLNVFEYFDKHPFTDLYLIAIHQLIKTNQPGIAIVPETFINSTFDKSKINRIVIIESNPFKDTTIPIVVVCFNGVENESTIIYKNDTKIGELTDLRKYLNDVNINYVDDLKFNDISGLIGVRCVDSIHSNNKIKFVLKNQLNYDLENVKNTSRVITVISSLKLEKLKNLNKFINLCNEILEQYRANTQDITLSPFKCNNEIGVRRRRLDFKLCRKIINLAYIKLTGGVDETN